MERYTNLDRTKAYLDKLQKWSSGPQVGNAPDSRYFPNNEVGDMVLVLNASRFYNHPIAESSFVNRTQFLSHLDHLVGSMAQVIGFSDINYYDPWDLDLQLTFDDETVLYVDAWEPAHRSDIFTFIPHPDCFEEYTSILKYLSKNPARVALSLSTHYTHEGDGV